MKKLTLVFTLLFVLILAGCENVHQYKVLPTDPQKGEMIEVDGVRYRTLPETVWRPLDGLELVTQIKGDGWESDICMYTLDAGHIFVMDQLNETNHFRDVTFSPKYYYREDITLPTYDRNGVDMLGFKKEGLFSNYVFIQNKELTDKIFELKDQSKKINIEGAFDFVYYLQLMNSNYPGIGIKATVYQKNKTYWIFFNDDDSTVSPISQDLLEQIAGEKLPVASN